MAYLLIRHEVKEFRAWKSVFDSFNEIRRAGGERSYQIFHPEDDPNNLWLLFEWDNLDNARAFMASQDLEKTMAEAGVTELPETFYLEEYGKGTP
ncbi:MAG: antibiotic biosynthesis monooxygenase [Pseudomonadota bacterium]